MHRASFREVQWDDVAAQVKAVNPELFDIIEALSPDHRYPLYVGEYPFGHQILRKGKFYVPMEHGNSLPIDSDKLPKQLRADLSYNINTNPVSVVLKGSCEIFLEHPVTGIPITMMLVPTGSLVSVSRVVSDRPMHPAFIWNMTSGARTMFMLPKISQTHKCKRLRAELGLDIEPPKNMSEHWNVFRKIADASADCVWNTKVLYFSKAWFDRLDDVEWMRFKLLLLEKFRKYFDLTGNVFIYEAVYSLILKRRSLRPSLYINNIVKYLLQISMGLTPAIAPATNELIAPIFTLQKVFCEIYGLNNYIPTIMCPAIFDFNNPGDIAYYSLNNPGLLDTPRKRDNSSLISDLYDAQSLLRKYVDDLENYDMNIRGCPLFDVTQQVAIDAFHTKPSQYSNINPIEKLIEEDHRFSMSLFDAPSANIASHSPFFKGIFRFKSARDHGA